MTTPTPLGPPPLAATVLEGHLSPQEARELAIIRWIHEGSGIIQRFRESGALADNVEWIVPGPQNILPFRSEILRLYTFDSAGEKIVRVRNFYDTGAYVSAVRGGPP